MPATLSQRADMALSELDTNGGRLSAEQNNQFIQDLIDQPTLLNESRTVPMDSPEMKINKIGFGARILHPAPGGTSPYADDDGTNDRYLAAAKRAKPVTSKVTITTDEVMAEVRIPYEIFEDNIERGGMESTVLAMIAEEAAKDLEDWLLNGDTALNDNSILDLQNGVLQRTTSHVVDAASATISATIFNNAIKALPTKYRRNLSQMRFYSSMDREMDYRLALSTRGTDLGDAIITGRTAVPVLGVPLKGAALMPNANILFCNPQNLIFGIQRNVRIETDKDIRSREVIFVLTCRVGIQVQEEDALVKVINLG